MSTHSLHLPSFSHFVMVFGYKAVPIMGTDLNSPSPRHIVCRVFFLLASLCGLIAIVLVPLYFTGVIFHSSSSPPPVYIPLSLPSSSSSSTGTSSPSSSTGSTCSTCPPLYCDLNPNPCQNGFNCTSIGVTTYTCGCSSAYVAPNCTYSDLLLYLPLNGTLLDASGHNVVPYFTGDQSTFAFDNRGMGPASYSLTREVSTSVGGVVDLQTAVPTKAWTISVLVRFDQLDMVTLADTQASKSIIGTVDPNGIRMGIGSGTHRIAINGATCNSSTSVVPATWTQLAFTYNITTGMAHLYVDGTSACNVTAPGYTGGSNLQLFNSAGTRYMAGSAAQLRIQQHELSVAEIQTLLQQDTSSLQIIGSGLRVFLPFNGTLKDYSGWNVMPSLVPANAFNFTVDPITGQTVLTRWGSIKSSTSMGMPQIQMRASFTFMLNYKVMSNGNTNMVFMSTPQGAQFGLYSSFSYAIKMQTSTPRCQEPTIPPRGTWQHTAFTYNNATGLMTTYRNGIQTCSTVYNPWSGSYFNWGGLNMTLFNTYNGDASFANFRHYDYAVGAAEVEHWANVFVPTSATFPVSNLLSNISFATNFSSINDLGHTARLIEGLGVTAAGVGVFPNALSAGSVVAIDTTLPTSFTKSIYMKVNVSSANQFQLLSSSPPSSTTDGTNLFYVDTNAAVCAKMYAATNVASACFTPLAWTPGTFYHFATTYNAVTGVSAVYVNGFMAVQNTGVSAFSTAWNALSTVNATQVGAQAAYGTWQQCQVFGEMMFNRELTPNEVYTVAKYWIS